MSGTRASAKGARERATMTGTLEPEPVRRSREHALVLLLALAAPLALFVLGRALRPDPRGFGTHEQLGFGPCWPMAHWNLPCPGCGVTTAVALAAHGEELASLRTQPLGLALLLATLAGGAWALVGHARGRDLALELARFHRPAVWLSAGTFALGAWLYKIALVRGWLG